MSAIPYKYYRVYITKTQTPSYASISELELYEDASMSSANFAATATATASSVYSTSSSVQPKNAIDGKTTTWWSSASMTSGASSGPQWLKLTLPTARVLRAFRITCNVDYVEVYKDFEMQGSHDGAEWFTLFSISDNTDRILTEVLSISISGYSNIDTGERALAVFVRDWVTGELISKVIPNNDGSWRVAPKNNNALLITHVGPSGYEPKSDGPVAPYSW